MSAEPERLALIAGSGRLPALMLAALDPGQDAPVIAEMDGFAAEGLGDRPVERFRIERLVPFFDRLHDLGVTRVAFAGAVRRPPLDPALFDPRTAALVPRVMAAIQSGDDAALRTVIALFEEAGFAVLGTADLAPALLPDAGVLGRVQPTAQDARDATRAADIVAALGAVDVGQGAVVARGLCLAVEALPGTDAMLAGLASLPRPAALAAPSGLLYKAPKPGQDRRIDLPSLGPGTVAAAAAAGLAGIAFEAGGVLLLDRAETVAAADAAGLFLWSRGAEPPA